MRFQVRDIEIFRHLVDLLLDLFGLFIPVMLISQLFIGVEDDETWSHIGINLVLEIVFSQDVQNLGLTQDG